MSKLAVSNVRTAKPLPKPVTKEVVGTQPRRMRKISPVELRMVEDENEVIKLRKRGMSYADIARKLQIGAGTAVEMARRAYQRIKDSAEDIEQARELDLARLDSAILVVMAELEGNPEVLGESIKAAIAQAKLSNLPFRLDQLAGLKGVPNPDMADKLVKLINQRAKLLGTEKQPEEGDGRAIQRVYVGIDINSV